MNWTTAGESSSSTLLINDKNTHTSFICILTPSVWFSLQLHSNSDKGDGSVRYILDGEGAGTIFIIDEVTGDIHATKSLDREKKSHYVLHAQALDRYTEEALEPKSEFIIKVQDINDNAPKFPDGPFVATVPEMSEVGESRFKVQSIWNGGRSQQRFICFQQNLECSVFNRWPPCLHTRSSPR